MCDEKHLRALIRRVTTIEIKIRMAVTIVKTAGVVATSVKHLFNIQYFHKPNEIILTPIIFITSHSSVARATTTNAKARKAQRNVVQNRKRDRSINTVYLHTLEQNEELF